MASTAKYQPAPTQDPDEGTWSQAPPSYQADEATTASSSANPGGIFAEPRSSEDNIPDDFKVRYPCSWPSV
jgi:protein lifeguard